MRNTVGVGDGGGGSSSQLLRRWWRAMPLMMFSGACLAAHFGLWVWGLQHTSLPHSLLLVCCTPLLLSFGSLVLCFPISRGEIGGSMLGALGVALMAADVRETTTTTASTGIGGGGGGENDVVTWYGDVLSLGAAAAIIGYMLVGHKLRQWMPLFLYAFPVTFTAAVVLAMSSVVGEGTKLFCGTEEGGAGVGGGSQSRSSGDAPAVFAVFGWLCDTRSFAVTTYLAVGPGLVGHTGYNGVLRYISPLAVSITLTMEPLFGSVLGWAIGVSTAPSWRAFLGGAVLLAAVVVVVASQAARAKS